MSLLDTADRVLGLVDSGAEAAEAQVGVRRERSGLTRFANSFVHQNVAEDTVTVSLRLTLEGRTASATATSTDEDALQGLVQRTTAAARVRPVDPGWPGLAPPAPLATRDNIDPAVCQASPEDRAEVVGAFVTAAGGLECAGYCETMLLEEAYANSAGQRVLSRSTAATLDGIARTPGADGSARWSSPRLADLDGAAAGARAADTARRASDADDLEPGRYEVVLSPSCVSNVLAFLGLYGFNGKMVNEGQSFAQLGGAQFDPAFRLWDDATDPRTVGALVDAEGTPKRRVDLVRDGITTGVVHDRRTAAVAGAGAQSTGSAVEGGERWGALPVNLVVGAGDRSFDELIGAVGRGLLVTDFWYTRILDPRTQVVTGLTRNGVFLIEDGKVTRPVGNLRFTQSFVGALGPGQVLGVGDTPELVRGGQIFGDAGYLAPYLHLASWNFTGNARG